MVSPPSDANPFVQPFCAALLAGIIGVGRDPDGQLSSLPPSWSPSAHAWCLVPGPHFLNGAIDLARTRIALGACRIGYANSHHPSLSVLDYWPDCHRGALSCRLRRPRRPFRSAMTSIAAGVAVAAYGTFFAMPRGMLPIPIVIGMLAQKDRGPARSDSASRWPCGICKHPESAIRGLYLGPAG